MKDTIIYEQPLNEVIRVCLRLEQLFQQIDHQMNDTSKQGTRNLMGFIINLLQVVDRPDLKAKLAKELSYHLANLQRYGESPDIDAQKLNHLTHQLDHISRSLIDSSGKIAYRLRDIELLNSLRLHFSNPGGGCSFDTPLFHHWLEKPAQIRQEIIAEWMNDFNQIKTASDLVLELVRKNAKVEEKTALHGFHQELLDPQYNLRMIRIGITRGIDAYPETSLGRHFFSVRFFSPDIKKRPTQYSGNLPFWVWYCAL